MQVTFKWSSNVCHARDEKGRVIGWLVKQYNGFIGGEGGNHLGKPSFIANDESEAKTVLLNRLNNPYKENRDCFQTNMFTVKDTNGVKKIIKKFGYNTIEYKGKLMFFSFSTAYNKENKILYNDRLDMYIYTNRKPDMYEKIKYYLTDYLSSIVLDELVIKSVMVKKSSLIVDIYTSKNGWIIY